MPDDAHRTLSTRQRMADAFGLGEWVDRGDIVGQVADGLRVVERLYSPDTGVVLRVATAAVTEPGADCFWVAVGRRERNG